MVSQTYWTILENANRENDVTQAIAQTKNDVKEPFGWFAGSSLRQ